MNRRFLLPLLLVYLSTLPAVSMAADPNAALRQSLVELYIDLANTNLKHNQIEHAKAHLAKAMAIAPDDPKVIAMMKRLANLEQPADATTAPQAVTPPQSDLPPSSALPPAVEHTPQPLDAVETVPANASDPTTALIDELTHNLQISGTAVHTLQPSPQPQGTGTQTWKVKFTIKNTTEYDLQPVGHALVFDTDDALSIPSCAVASPPGEKELAIKKNIVMSCTTLNIEQAFKPVPARETYVFEHNFKHDLMLFSWYLEPKARDQVIVALPEYAVQNGANNQHVRVIAVCKRTADLETWEVAHTIVVPVQLEALVKLIANREAVYAVRAMAAFWLMDIDPVEAFKAIANNAHALQVNSDGFGRVLLLSPFSAWKLNAVTDYAKQLLAQPDAAEAAKAFAQAYLAELEKK